MRSSASRRQLPTHLSATEFARGAISEVRITRAPSDLNTSSAFGANFVSRSWDQVAKLDAVVFEPPAELPDLLSRHLLLGRFGRTAHCQDPPSRQVNKEEKVEAPEEYASRQKKSAAMTLSTCALRNCFQLSPDRRGAGGRLAAISTDRIVVAGNRVAQLQQFAAHPEVTPARGSRAIRMTSWRTSFEIGGLPRLGRPR